MRNIIFTLLSLILLSSCNNFLPPQSVKPIETKSATGEQSLKLEATYESIKANIIDQKCISCHVPGAKGEEILLETQDQILKGVVGDKALIVPGKASESQLYLVLLEDISLRGELKKMPPPKAIEQKKVKAITQEEIDVIAAWINGSAKKTAEQEAKVVVEQQHKETKPTEENKTISEEKSEVASVVINYDYIKTQVLDKKCLKCHKPGGKSEDLDFSSRKEILLATTDVGEAIIVVNKPESSLLYLSLLPNQADRQGAKKMPTAKAVKAGEVEDITPEETKLIEEWIKQGAP